MKAVCFSIPRKGPIKFYGYVFTFGEFIYPCFVGDSVDIDEDAAKELEHTYLQNSMDKELNELNRQLEKKEVLIFYVLQIQMRIMLSLQHVPASHF